MRTVGWALSASLLACTPTHGPTVDAGAVNEVTDPPQPETAAAEWTSGFVAHEWGTFTAVADGRGSLVDWRPLLGASDLPSFVYRQPEPPELAGKSYKSAIPAAIRMETPVIYFYADVPRSVDVRVTFDGGTITEWYPDAKKRSTAELVDAVDWERVEIVPGVEGPDLRREAADSHYYPARETDAALVRRGAESEKFLFYRGVGHFALRITATMAEDRVRVANAGEASSMPVFVVHARDGRVGFVVMEGDTFEVEVPQPDGDLDALLEAMREQLVATGLYGREADAMIATWRDHWFEDDGVRLFYVMHDDAVEARLPLVIDPRPEEIVRTMVGRIELMTPDLRERAQLIVDAAADPVKACEDLRRRHGRFADPLAQELVGDKAEAVRTCLREE